MDALTGGRRRYHSKWPGFLELMARVAVPWLVLAGVALVVYVILAWVWP